MKTRTYILIFSTILGYLITSLICSIILTQLLGIEFSLMLSIIIIITSILAPFGIISIYKGFRIKFLNKLGINILGQELNKEDNINIYKTITVYSFLLSLLSYSIPLMYDGMVYDFSYIVMRIVIISIVYCIFCLICVISIYKIE